MSSTRLFISVQDELLRKRRIIEGLGLIYNSYKVTTEDGYILNLNRMVNPYLKNQRDKGIPVLLVHGLCMHSDSWMLQVKPENNIPVAWLLAGFDIWMGDQRGSIRSRNHTTLSVESSQFWDFSFHEIGVRDLPAFIKFILNSTKHEKLVYAGLSNGGTYYYIMCTERPEFQKYLYGGILYAPVGESPLFTTMSLIERIPLQNTEILAHKITNDLHFPGTDIKLFLDMKIFGNSMFIVLGNISVYKENRYKVRWELGYGKFPLLLEMIKTNFYAVCKLNPFLMKTAVAHIWGPGCSLDAKPFCGQFLLSLGGTSGKTFIHNTQLFENDGIFRQYDYDYAGNLIRYGWFTPPEYNMKKLKVFTAIYHSDIDIFAPSRTILPLAHKFGGPKYLCRMKGVCHTFVMVDPRVSPYVKDATELLLSMTGRKNSTKMSSGTCGDIDV